MSLAVRQFLRLSRVCALENATNCRKLLRSRFLNSSCAHSHAAKYWTSGCLRTGAHRVLGESGRDDEEEYADAAFGSLANKQGVEVFKLPPELKYDAKDEEVDVSRRRSRNTPYWYFLQCRRLAKEHKVVECLRFFEEKMLKEDRVFPEEYNFSVVIGALGRIGHTKKAFHLYKQLKERGLRPTAATFTGLFNSVAQSPSGTEIWRAVKLYKEVHRRKIRLNRVVYNAAIKAFGRHGSTEQMMGVFRESIIKGFEPDSETFNMLLLSVEKDKEAGSRHAIEVWRQMIMLGIEPDGKTVLYLLRVLKNCGIGDPVVAYRKLIEELPDPSEYKDFFKRHVRNVYWLKGQQSTPRVTDTPDAQLPPTQEIITLEAGVVAADINWVDTSSDTASTHPDFESTRDSGFEGNNAPENSENLDIGNRTGISARDTPTVTSSSRLFEVGAGKVVASPDQSLPNLLTLPFDNAIISAPTGVTALQGCKYPANRLKLIGGHRYIFDVFEKYNIPPTVMVLSTLMQVLESTSSAENEVMEFAAKWKVKLDIDFYNMLLRKKVRRKDHQVLQEVLQKVAEAGLTPNYRTWCIAALSCEEGWKGVQLIKEVKNIKIPLDHIFYNSLITGALKRKAVKVKGYKGVYGLDYRYLTRIVNEMKASGAKVDAHTISLLEGASDWPEGYDRWKTADSDLESKVFHFRKVYKEWLDVVEVVKDKEPFQEFDKAAVPPRAPP